MHLNTNKNYLPLFLLDVINILVIIVCGTDQHNKMFAKMWKHIPLINGARGIVSAHL